MAFWRALAIVMVLVGGAAAQPRTTPFGFDHMVHARNLDVGGHPALPCARCHVEKAGKLVGKPGHSACFGACHGAAPTKPKRGAKLAFGDRERVCTNCHAESVQGQPFAGKLPVGYPPYTLDLDFNIAFGHKQHAAVQCTPCHDVRGGKQKTPPHARCSGCHDGSRGAGKGPAMSRCVGCHPQAVGNPTPPELAAVRDSVTTVFSHAKHNTRGPIGKDCGTCHAAIRATDDTQLPRPTVQNCSVPGCHDGKTAFPATAACTRCHDKEPTDRFEVHRPTARFTHVGAHAEAVAKQPCAACHPLSVRGEIQVAGHAACATCHAADFGARTPKICGACHNATEPWRPLVADRAPPDRTEFGAMLDHSKHPQPCESCHSLRTPSSQLRPPRGHASCIGNACHAPTSGPVPRLTECARCHEAGLAVARESTRALAPWSVRGSFDHAKHRTAPDNSPLACRACHTDLAGTQLAALPTPKKATCTPCHDGTKAFKLTGTTCTRCHTGGT